MIATKATDSLLKLGKLGFSHSYLNNCFHLLSLERIQEIAVDMDINLRPIEDDNLELVSERGENCK